MPDIDKGVPVPPLRERKNYPYKDLEVGDSFYAETKSHLMLNNNYKNGKRLGRKFILRKEGNGVRVWRVQ